MGLHALDNDGVSDIFDASLVLHGHGHVPRGASQGPGRT